MKYSVIVPVFNEKESVSELHREIVEVMRKVGQPFEIIFVDDGSRDGTYEVLLELRPIRIIRFRKNFGQTAALDAGFKHAQGEIFITLDGDGQNDPADIPRLLEALQHEKDVVSGWRYQRQDSFSKRLISRGADLLRRYFINDGVHDSGCTLKVYRRECFDGLSLHGEMHRFIPGILRLQGFRVGEVKVNHRPRLLGQTKYNWKRVIKGFIDMIAVWFWRKYSSRPLHLFGGLGILIGSAGFVLGVVLFILRVLNILSLQGRIWPLVAIFAVLAGLQLVISGLLADIVVKSYYNGTRTAYSIREIIERE